MTAIVSPVHFKSKAGLEKALNAGRLCDSHPNALG
jgi:hypothetical protein